jgi:DNA-directed RNA polymerase II subunit RPB1
MIPIFRSGLLSDDTGPIAKCTFEEQTAMLLQASRHGDVDPMRGVSANVMCGQFGNYGTSSFQLVLDMDAVVALEATPLSQEVYDDEDDEGDDVQDTVLKSKLTIHNNITLMMSEPTAGPEEDEPDDYNLGF